VIAVVVAVVALAAGVVVAVLRAVDGAVDQVGEDADLDTSDEGALAVGEPTRGSVAPGGRDRWTLTGVDGAVTVTVAGSTMDPILTVSEVGGPELGTNDDADGTDSRLTVDLVAGRRYYVEVREFGDDVGAYVVLAQRGDESTPAVEAGALTIGAPSRASSAATRSPATASSARAARSP